nr:hypothetical protein [uncultured Ligilactobacillus sp.]
MKKKFFHLFTVLGTILMVLTSLVTSVGAVTISSSSLSSSLQASSKSLASSSSSRSKSSSQSSAMNSNSSQSMAISASSMKSSSVASVLSQNNSASSAVANNSTSTMSSNASSVAPTTADKPVTYAADSSSNATTAGSAGKIGETIIKTDAPYANALGSSHVNSTDNKQAFIYPHFQTANGDVTYCYNWQWDTPDVINGTKYNEYDFYDGLTSVTGDQKKVAQVAAALEGGYHKTADGTYDVGPQFKELAKQDYEKLISNPDDPNYSALDGMYDSNYNYNTKGINYTLAMYEQDVT